MKLRHFVALLVAVVAASCGGRVVVDAGAGGSGAGSSSGSGGSVSTCTPMPDDSKIVIEVCVAELPGGGCAQDTLADVVAQTTGPCSFDDLCGCNYEFSFAPCPPKPGCCYEVEVDEYVSFCE